jgi:exosortase A
MLWLLRDTVMAMVAIWAGSETFTHAFLVLPISAWLIWRRREQLAALPLQPQPWLLPLVALLCFAWLMGDLAAVGVVSQFALVTLLILVVPTVYGWPLARAITFPLLFLYFAVPFGLFTAPQLMEWTADFTVLALRMSGVPVYREGMDFVIPSGNWSVVEACSGVRYLIASFMVGTLFAYLNYQSTRRRVIFILLSLTVPLVANWLRAYMIVMIGHLSNNTLAVGVDHLLYGWVFFGVVMGLLYVLGARWSEPDAVVIPKARAAESAAAASRPGWVVALGAVVLVGLTQAWAWHLDHPDARQPPTLQTPAPATGWEAGVDPLPWPPGFLNPSSTAAGQYVRADRPVWLWAAYYQQQGEYRKLISTVNRLVPAGYRDWRLISQGRRADGPGLPAFRTAELRRGVALGAQSADRLRVWQVYWVGGRWTESDVLGKLYQAVQRLLGRGDDGAVVLLVTPLDDAADSTLEDFARLQLPTMGALLEKARDTGGLQKSGQ